jgi:hypothetical protein
VTISTGNDIYYDPYDIVLNADPYPMFGRLRDEAPLYYNAQHDFYALSRFADVDKGPVETQPDVDGAGVGVDAGLDAMTGRVEGL